MKPSSLAAASPSPLHSCVSRLLSSMPYIRCNKKAGRKRTLHPNVVHEAKEASHPCRVKARAIAELGVDVDFSAATFTGHAVLHIGFGSFGQFCQRDLVSVKLMKN